MAEEKITYEEAIAELNQIINKLNTGSVSLDESIKLYQRGMKLSAFCDAKLKEVEQKISVVNKETLSEDILKINEDGNLE